MDLTGTSKLILILQICLFYTFLKNVPKGKERKLWIPFKPQWVAHRTGQKLIRSKMTIFLLTSTLLHSKQLQVELHAAKSVLPLPQINHNSTQKLGLTWKWPPPPHKLNVINISTTTTTNIYLLLLTQCWLNFNNNNTNNENYNNYKNNNEYNNKNNNYNKS